jgi:hypothetical protein
MSRKHGELQFGSDSFLDVLCNLVGILILLMVIAGVRVSRAPVMILPRMTAVSASDIGGAEADAESPFHAVIDEPVVAGAPVEVETAVEPPPDDTSELSRAIADFEREQEQLTLEYHQNRDRLAAAFEQESAVGDRLAATRESLTATQRDLSTVRQAITTTTAELGQLRDQAVRLAEQVQSAQHQSPAQQIRHKITPVSKTVTGDELHFRLEQNRVAVIPLETLLKRLKDQIELRKEWLMKSRQHEGEVGPVDGFTLRYLVQRDNLSVVDELRYGSGMYRISVARWELEVDRSAVMETADQALRPGSRFYQALLEAKSESALTFWVYPDSFEAYGKLKSFCHDQNFLVAGRPLPAGVPIAGSPQGSRSSGQ